MVKIGFLASEKVSFDNVDTADSVRRLVNVVLNTCTSNLHVPFIDYLT